MDIPEFFQGRVQINPDGCFVWLGAKNEKGYGNVKFCGKIQKAHRVAFYLKHSYWPNQSRHSCANPSCVNADHIVDGNQSDNMQDSLEQGRYFTRQRLKVYESQRALTPEQISQVKRLYASGMTQKELATAFSVGRQSIRGALKA